MKVSRGLITIGLGSRAALPHGPGGRASKDNVSLFGKPEAFRTSGGKAAIRLTFSMQLQGNEDFYQ